MKHDIAQRITQTLGRELPPTKSVHGLDQLPADVLEDIEKINETCGGIYVFAYLRHITDASFSDVKLYVDGRGWHHSAD